MKIGLPQCFGNVDAKHRVPSRVVVLVSIVVLLKLPFPDYLPVTTANTNYFEPVFGVVLFGAVTLWFVRGRSEWDGPNKAVIDYALKNES